METLIVFIALLLALVEEFNAHGRSFVGWAVVLLCITFLLDGALRISL